MMGYDCRREGEGRKGYKVVSELKSRVIFTVCRDLLYIMEFLVFVPRNSAHPLILSMPKKEGDILLPSASRPTFNLNLHHNHP